MCDHHTHFPTFWVHQFPPVIAQIQFVQQSIFFWDGQKSASDSSGPYSIKSASMVVVAWRIHPGNDVIKLEIIYIKN
jgi:hypothetical protein